MTYLDALAEELKRARLGLRRRKRILTEFADHLRCDPQADLGAPRELARQFADELGTSQSRRATAVSFGALAVAGLLFGVAFVLSPNAAFGARSGAHSQLLGAMVTAVAVIAPQLAFVTGVLAALRALRRRGEVVLPAQEATIIVRRAAVALAAGIATMLALGGIALEFSRALPSGWQTYALVASAIGTAALLVAAPLVVSAGRIRPQGDAGPSQLAGDVFDDLAGFVPPALDGRPWLFAFATATAVALALTAAGAVQSDVIDGAARGIADGLACMAGFGLLGRYLGLRSGRATD